MDSEENQAKLTRYLLGLLPDAEQAAIEKDYFEDKEKFEQIWSAENDLVDDYLRGKLSLVERAQFENRFLSTAGGRERLTAAKILLTSISAIGREGTLEDGAQSSVAQSSFGSRFMEFLRPRRSLAFAFATLIVLLAIAASWGLIETIRLRRQLHQSQMQASEQQQQQQREFEEREQAAQKRSEDLRQELDRARNEMPAPAAQTPGEQAAPSQVSLVLTAGLARGGGETSSVKIQEGTQSLVLKLVLTNNDYQSYTAALRTVEGANIWTGRAIKPVVRGGDVHLALSVPAARLARNDYILRLSAITSTGATEDAGQFTFRVER
jgi:hypothetical protein